MSGAFQTSREIFNNPIWKNITEFRIFFLIYGNAIFAEEGYRVSNDLHLERGQWLRSTRKLQEDLMFIENRQTKKYSTATINRCIKSLVASQRLCTKTHELGTVFTVVNYESYQGFEAYRKDNLEQNLEHSRNSDETVTKQRRNNNNKDNKDNNDKKEIKEKNPNRKRVYDEDSSPYKLAVYLYSKISEWTDQVNPPNLQTWADECRMILELDKRDKQTVKDVIDWATKDNFWQSNILSPKSLRKQFVRLSIELTKSINTNNGNYSSDLKIIAGGQAKGKPSTTSKIQELYRQAEEAERREAHGGY